MLTRSELQKLRLDAELAAEAEGGVERWRKAWLDFATAADRLDAMIGRIERGEENACLKIPRETVAEMSARFAENE